MRWLFNKKNDPWFIIWFEGFVGVEVDAITLIRGSIHLNGKWNFYRSLGLSFSFTSLDFVFRIN